MAERVPDDLGGPESRLEQRQYFPSSMTRFATPDFACTDDDATDVAEYSPLIAVAYTPVHANLEADLLAIGFERRNDEFWQTPKAKEYASAQRAGIDALAPRRRTGPASGRAGSPARPSCRAGSVRGADEGTLNDALLMSQESAL
jgi:hypothetical protein